MRAHNPTGRLLPALEHNILKYRALEMLMVLFEIEHLKDWVVASIQATDESRKARQQRIPKGVKNKVKLAWSALLTTESLLRKKA
jgi:hypothetical protein